DGRGAGVGSPAIGFAAEGEAMPEHVALAYAKAMKTPVNKAPAPTTFEQRFSAWGGAYGGSGKMSRDTAAAGSPDVPTPTGGFAAGVDYRGAPGSVVGFALAGGGTNWALGNGTGTGRSDVFQAGLYGSTGWGALYLSAALAYAWYDVSTDRFSLAGNQLRADFNAHSIGGRVETGYRFATALVSII